MAVERRVRLRAPDLVAAGSRRRDLRCVRLLASVGADRVYGVAAILGSAAVLLRIAMLRLTELRLEPPAEVWHTRGVRSTTIIID